MDDKLKLKNDVEGDENDYDDNAGGIDDSKETTGRWTKEEHLAFIKGLEQYGKGWKKIAGLVKTRTVVQIRTHAQKYFLKLSKARQAGDTAASSLLSADGKPGSTIGRKRKLKKRSDKPTALAPPLQPFLKPTANREALRSHEVEDVLYNFLSPDLAVALTSETGDVHVHTLPTQPLLPLPPSSSFTTGSSNGHNLIVKTERISEISEQESLRSPRQRPAQDNNSSQLTADIAEQEDDVKPVVPRLVLHSSLTQLPVWYKKKEQVSSLLKEAEDLDWLEDHASVYGFGGESFEGVAGLPSSHPSEGVEDAFQSEPPLSFEVDLKGGVEGGHQRQRRGSSLSRGYRPFIEDTPSDKVMQLGNLAAALYPRNEKEHGEELLGEGKELSLAHRRPDAGLKTSSSEESCISQGLETFCALEARRASSSSSSSSSSHFPLKSNDHDSSLRNGDHSQDLASSESSFANLNFDLDSLNSAIVEGVYF